LQCVAACCSVLQRVAVCCSVLQCVAVCCSVLQCAAVCHSVLQCVAEPQRKSYSSSPTAGSTFSASFVDVYCSTLQGLLDCFEVDLRFTELSFIQIDFTFSVSFFF